MCTVQFKQFVILFLVFMLILKKGQCRVLQNLTIKVHKCCQLNQTLVDNDCDSYSGNSVRALHRRYVELFKNENFQVDANFDFDCPQNKNSIFLFEADKFMITNTSAITWIDKEHHIELPRDEYCLDVENGSLVAITCQDPFVVAASVDLNKYGMLISIPFLFLTLLVYVILPEKKIQTKCLMAYVTCLMFAYFFLIYLQLASLEDPECTIFASCGIYFFMATFCWMNVTCVDMFWTFSGRRPFQQGNSSKWKRFGMYCLFANGAPFILLGVIFGLNSLEEFKGHPGFADGQCWLEQGLPQLLYFYGPMAVLLTINTILFIITAITIRSTIVDNQRTLRGSDSHRHNDDNKQDYRLYIKLFIAMGINWIMEFISWIVDWNLGSNKIPWLWYPTDFCNAIYGVFIFMIFVCKKTVWIKLRQRYYILMGKPNMARALSTRTSGYQMSQTERTNMDESTVYK